MSTNPDPSGITEALFQALDATKEGQRAQEGAESQQAEAEAAEGRVKVTANLAGKVDVVITDPRAFRKGVEYLSAEVTQAVNAALDAARQQAGVPGAVDLAELSSKLEAVQQQSTQRLQSFMANLSEAHAQIARGAGKEDGRR